MMQDLMLLMKITMTMMIIVMIMDLMSEGFMVIPQDLMMLMITMMIMMMRYSRYEI